MFTPTDRNRIRQALIASARTDRDVVGAALVGSGATDAEDDWSDIDLALQVRNRADPDRVAARWTADVYDRLGAADHLDLVADGVLYRVFLLHSSLQVDLSFWPEQRFGPTEPGFRLLFGKTRTSSEPRSPDVDHTIGMAWLYAVHARSALARGRTWQAVQMLDHLRDQLLVLACIRAGLNPHHGREVDQLPRVVLGQIARARASTTTTRELIRSHVALLDLLHREIAQHSTERAERLQAPLAALAQMS